MTVPYEDILAKLPPERREKVRARAADLVAEEYVLRELRKARRLTQTQVAERLGGRQVYVSRLEQRTDMKLSTLRDYARALGGELQVMVTFPEGDTVKLKSLGAATPARDRRRQPTKRTA